MRGEGAASNNANPIIRKEEMTLTKLFEDAAA